MTAAVSHFLAVLAFLSAAFILLTLGALIAKASGKKTYLAQMSRLVSPIWLEAVFIVTLVSTLGSLFYSEVAGFEPCRLCWYQRIFMYPQTVMASVAMARKEAFVKPYLIALSFMGLVIALYHNALQWFPHLFPEAPCDAAGVSCAKIYPVAFSWVTIPMMSAIAFSLILTILIVYGKEKPLSIVQRKKQFKV